MTGDRFAFGEIGDVPVYRQEERYRELEGRRVLAAAKAKLEAEGRPFDPEGVIEPASYEPLTARERLEAVALGTAIARSYAHPVHVHLAAAGGASWQEIADAAGEWRDPDRVRRDYRAWAERSHDLYRDRGFGMDDAEHAAALARSETSVADAAARAQGLPARADLDAATAATAATISSPEAGLLDVLRAAQAEEAVFEAYRLRPGAAAELQAGI